MLQQMHPESSSVETAKQVYSSCLLKMRIAIDGNCEFLLKQLLMARSIRVYNVSVARQSHVEHQDVRNGLLVVFNCTLKDVSHLVAYRHFSPHSLA